MVRKTIEALLDGTANASQTAMKKSSQKLQSKADRGVTRRDVLKTAGVAAAGAYGLHELTDEEQGQELPYELELGETAVFADASDHPYTDLLLNDDVDARVPLDRSDYLTVSARNGEDGIALTVSGYNAVDEEEPNAILSMDNDEQLYSVTETLDDGHTAMTLQDEDGLHVSAYGAQSDSGTGDYASEGKVSLEFDWDTAGDR